MAVTLGQMVTLSNDLTLINQQLRAAFNQISRDYRLNITQCAILQKLADLTPDGGESNILALADGMGMSNAMISRQISSLMKQDLVLEWSDINDRRQRRLKLTLAGQKLLQKLEQIFEDTLETGKAPVHQVILAHIVETIRLLNDFSV